MKIVNICFSGFNYTTKLKLRHIAESQGFVVHDLVFEDTELLIRGKTVSNSKLTNAYNYGIPIVAKNDFLDILEDTPKVNKVKFFILFALILVLTDKLV